MYRASPELVLRKIGEDAILVPVRNRVGDLDSIFTLNDVALDVWKLLDGQASIDSIARAIATEYDVPLDVAVADVSELLHDLAVAGLVEQTGAT